MKCPFCASENTAEAEECRICGAGIDAKSRETAELRAEALESSKSVQVFTTLSPTGLQIEAQLGLVFGNSSKQAFWGLSTQANRLSRAYEAALINLKYGAALLGPNAVVGVSFALNNSTGSGNKLIAGSSEAVMLLGTAVIAK